VGSEPPVNRTPTTTSEVAGVSLLPPGPVTLAGSRLRGVLGRVYAAMAPPPARILMRVAHATGPSGRVVVVESEYSAIPRDSRRETAPASSGRPGPAALIDRGCLTYETSCRPSTS
jgi:hypothetical protein